jgi:hypothetical protein
MDDGRIFREAPTRLQAFRSNDDRLRLCSSGLTGPTRSDLSGTSVTSVPLFASGYESARARASACISPFARSRVTSDFKRPTTSIPIETLRSRNPGALHCPIGTYTSLRGKFLA